MKFVNVRELHINTAKVLAKTRQGEKVIVTNRGKPQAIISSISEKDLDKLGFQDELLLTSESALKKDWLKPEEEKAWKSL